MRDSGSISCLLSQFLAMSLMFLCACRREECTCIFLTVLLRGESGLLFLESISILKLLTGWGRLVFLTRFIGYFYQPTSYQLDKLYSLWPRVIIIPWTGCPFVIMALRHSEYLMSPYESVLRAPLIRDTSPLESERSENLTFISSSIKVSSTMLLEYAPNIINLYYLGNFCSLEVQSSYGVVLVLTFCVGFAFYQGLAAGMESFLASIKTDLSIVIYQRVILLSTILMFVVVGVLYLFKALVFPYVLPQISHIAGNMAIGATGSIYFNALYLISRSLSNSRQMYNKQLVSNVSTIIFHIVICQVIFKYLGWTTYGAIFTRTLSDIFNFNLFIYISKLRDEVQLQHFSACSFAELKTIARILIPRGLVILLEILAYQSFTFQTTSLPMKDIETHIIATNIHNVGYFLLCGVSIVSYINVSSYILDNEHKSKKFIKKGAFAVLTVALLYMGFLYFAPWRSFFTDIEEVSETLKPLLPYQMAFTLLDAMQLYVSSISRSLGQHKAAIKHFLISYFLVGQISCVILKKAFPENSIENVWTSMIISVSTYNIWQIKQLNKATFKEARAVIQEELQEERMNDAMMFDEYIQNTKDTDMKDWSKFNST